MLCKGCKGSCMVHAYNYFTNSRKKPEIIKLWIQKSLRGKSESKGSWQQCEFKMRQCNWTKIT